MTPRPAALIVMMAGLLTGSPASFAEEEGDPCAAGDAAWEMKDGEAALGLWSRCLELDSPAAPIRAPDAGSDPARLYRIYLDADKHRDYARALPAIEALTARFPRHRYSSNLQPVLGRLSLFKERGFGELREFQLILDGFNSAGTAESARKMEAFLKEHPDSPLLIEAHLWLGGHYRKWGDPFRSQRHFAAILKLDPSSALWKAAQIQNADAKERTGEFDAAKDIYRQLLDRRLISETVYHGFLQALWGKRMIHHLTPVAWATWIIALLAALIVRFWRHWNLRAAGAYAFICAMLTLAPYYILRWYDPEENPPYLWELFLMGMAMSPFSLGAVGHAARSGRPVWWKFGAPLLYALAALFGFMAVLQHNDILLTFLLQGGGGGHGGH